MTPTKLFRFRRLKWGDPDEKFKLLSEDLIPPERQRDNYSERPKFAVSGFDFALIIVILVSLVSSGLMLFG